MKHIFPPSPPEPSEYDLLMSKDFMLSLKESEGTKELQEVKGYFRGGKFMPYKCSEGFVTIGYGHRVLNNENHLFNGIDEATAETMLKEDVHVSYLKAKTLSKKWSSFHDDVKRLLIEMVFQLGGSGASKFVRFLAALEVNDYSEAQKQLKSSRWNLQTPNRVAKHLKVLARLGRAQKKAP